MVEKTHTPPQAPSQAGDWWTGFLDPLKGIGSKISNFFAPNAEASATDDLYEIAVELPGVTENDIDITLHDGVLTVRGEKKFEREEKGKTFYFSERAYGAFHRSFRLPADVDESKVSASFKDGLLTVKVPKAAAMPEASKKIKISRG
ncbi:MAG: Hsp20/alpha crystallin family protein [Rhodospirillales bacterium]